MNGFLQRRIDVASCWASTRVTLLDGFEQYEDSYAITQEFREWITSIADHPEHLSSSVLMVPKAFKNSSQLEELEDKDEKLEI